MSCILKKTSTSPDKPRLVDQLNIDLGSPIELAVWAVKKAGIRCKQIPSQLPITYRMMRHEVEGEIITVIPSKIWQFKNTVYLSGKTIDSRLDVTALNLMPLKLEEQGVFEPDNATDLLEENDPFTKYYLPIIAFGSRREFEMEQIIPFENPEDWDSDPIIQAVDFYESGDRSSAFQILEELLGEDLRCIDAHAHLGNWEFDVNETSYNFLREKAKRHYEVGVRIAELSLGSSFHDLLPWSYINNRPYLRCLHGYGLCLWRSGKVEAAREVFEKMLWLNPRDNQGARFLLADIDAGKGWHSDQTFEQGIE